MIELPAAPVFSKKSIPIKNLEYPLKRIPCGKFGSPVAWHAQGRLFDWEILAN